MATATLHGEIMCLFNTLLLVRRYRSTFNRICVNLIKLVYIKKRYCLAKFVYKPSPFSVCRIKKRICNEH